jgi:hypothetical protein
MISYVLAGVMSILIFLCISDTIHPGNTSGR